MKSIFGAMNALNEFNEFNENNNSNKSNKFNKFNKSNKLNNSELNCVNRIKSSVYAGFIILSYGMDMMMNQFS